MTKKDMPWCVDMLEGADWVFLKRHEHQFQAKQHVNDYNRLYDDNLLSDAELEAAGPKVKMRVVFDGS